MKPRLIVFVGPHNSGKTGLIQRLVRRAAGEGVRVGVLKRAARPLEFEPAGKDSARFATARARRVVTIGPGLLAMLEQSESPGSMAGLARRFGRDLDVWLAESYMVERAPWVRVARRGQPAPPADAHCIATVGVRVRPNLPHFRLDQTGALWRFLWSEPDRRPSG
jgi:molybdopterin-guanine dinucleotide biosynthesis protein MobB